MQELTIRKALIERLKNYQKGKDFRIVEELGLCLGRARVDVAVINGSLQGYEIKSEQDTLKRLPEQSEIYNLVFDSVTIVSTEKHLRKIKDQVPGWWGLWEAKERGGKVVFSSLRRRSRNPGLDPLSIVQLLWKDELLEVLACLSLDSGMKSKPKRVLWQKLVDNVSPLKLGEIVRDRLRAREAWRADQ